MSTTLTMVPLAKIKARAGFNPRSDFGDEQMGELVASVKRHGIITPLTLAPDGDGFVIVAGERRYRAAKAAKLTEVPAQVRDADGEALTLAVAENVIRADLTPVEEGAAFARLPEIRHAGEYDWAARDDQERRQRACFALADDDADAARAFGCLLELPSPDGRRDHGYVTDPEWLADRLGQKIAAYAAEA